MKTITETIALVNRFNSNILKKSRDNFNELIFMNNVENEDDQKWAEVFCSDQDYYIEDSQNLSEDEENEIEEMLREMHRDFSQSASFARMCDATERHLMYN